jgi:hypothetical protein
MSPIIIVTMIYSVLAFICVYQIIKRGYSKFGLIIPVFLECISILAICSNNIGILGLGVFLGLIPLINLIQKNIMNKLS